MAIHHKIVSQVKARVLLGVLGMVILVYRPWITMLGLTALICLAVITWALMSLGWRISELTSRDPVKQLVPQDRKARRSYGR